MNQVDQGKTVGEMYGTAVRNLRKNRGMKAADLARATGLSPQEIWKVEVRNKTLPTTEVFDRIAKALNVPKELLLIESGYLDENEQARELDERLVAAVQRVPEGQIEAFTNSVTAIADALATKSA